MATAFLLDQPLDPEPHQRLSGLRVAPRYPFFASCQLDFDGLGRVTLPANDLSAAGLRVELAVFPEEGTPVRCAIPLPSGDFWVVRGYVARVIDGQGPTYGIAIAFDGVSADDRTQLAAAFG
jgi:hypothetical protein